MHKFLFLLLFPLTIFGQTTSTKFFIDGKYPGVVYKPSTWKATNKYTAVFFFHGRDEAGTGTDASLTQKIVNSGNHANLLLNAEKYGFMVIAPQLVTSLQNWQSGWTRDYIRRYYEYAFKTFNIDTSYFHATGLSLGGGAVWVTICDPIWSKKIAGAVPICGTPEYANDFLQPAINGVAVWAHHAKNDGTVFPIHSENQVRYINEKTPLIPARLTIYESGGHGIWSSVYGNDSVYKWMLAQKKGIVVPPVTPPPGKKVKYRIIVYDDGSIETIPEGTTSVPEIPGNKQQLLAISPHQIFDISQARKQPEKLFDRDTTTVAFNDYFNEYILNGTGGQIIYVLLDSFINNVKVELFNGQYAYGGQVEFQLFNSTDTSVRKSPVYSTTLESLKWKSLDLPWPDSARLLKIRIVSAGSNNFSEVKVYGNKLGPAPSVIPPASNSHETIYAYLSLQDEGKYFMGYNKLHTDTLLDDAGYSQRAINDASFLDTFQNTNGKKVLINKYGNSIKATYEAAIRNGRKVHPAIASVREAFKYGTSNDSKDMPKGADSTKIESWAIAASTYYALAAKMGRNETPNIDGYVFYNTPDGYGLMVTEEIEVGNEDDARWAGPLRFHAPLVKLRKLKAAYDAIKKADPTMKVISGALTGVDTSYAKAMWLTCKFLGIQPPFDVLAVNEYATNAGGQHQGTSDGVSPEDFKMYDKLAALIKTRDRYFPGIPVYLTEFGYDVHVGSNYDVPDIPGQTREQTKAYWVLRTFEEAAAAKISKAYQYTAKTAGGGDFGTTGMGEDSILKPNAQIPDYLKQFTEGKHIGGGYIVFPTFLYWAMVCRAKTLADYNAWPVIVRNGGNTGIWILKYSHVSDTRKSVFSFWSGTSNNTVINNYQLSVGGTTAALFTPTVGIKQNRTALNVNSGSVWVSVTECPQYVEVTI